MFQQVVVLINKIVSHYIDVEEKHYEENPSSDHIYLVLLKLQKLIQ